MGKPIDWRRARKGNALRIDDEREYMERDRAAKWLAGQEASVAYLGDKVIGNFKQTKTARQKAKVSKPADKRADRPGNSEAHLAAIRKLPCCVTLRTPAGECHHLKQTGERGAGMRSSDRWAVPLSHVPHMELEREGSRNERAWFERHGIDAPLDLAAALWAASPDVARMTKIVIAHKRRK